MYIESVPNRNSPPCVLLRESYRDRGRVKKRTLANLTHWPEEVVSGLRELLKGVEVVGQGGGFEITRSLPHGHVALVRGMATKLRIESLLSKKPSRERSLVLSMLLARVLSPQSKLATTRGLGTDTLSMSLGEELGLGDVEVEELYSAMDWLYSRQKEIEQKLAKQHLSDGTLVLYDVTSTYFEGTKCPLAKRGYSRDRKKGKLQIVIGLLCNKAGCPVSIEVYEGNTSDPLTLKDQILKVRERFGLQHVVFVGDRGMLTSARIDEELRGVEGLEWLSCLTHRQIEVLVREEDVQQSLWEEKDLAEIHSPRYPGERLIVCHNSFLGEKRARVREELLELTESELEKIVETTKRQTRCLKGKDKIALRVGRIINKYNKAKFFKLVITDDSFHYERDEEKIAEEKRLDGVYVVRTSVSGKVLHAADAVSSYKSLSRVERAFRSMKTVDLKVRPIYHRLAERVKAHVFLCMLAYYVEWHMRQGLAPILFDDHDRDTAREQQKSPVQRAQVSPAAQHKAATKTTVDGYPVHSFQSLLKDLATITKSTIQPQVEGAPSFFKLTQPSPIQSRAFQLLDVRL